MAARLCVYCSHRTERISLAVTAPWVEAGWTATVDTPANLHYRRLMELYPEAKVVLTVHPKGARGWLRSFKALEFFETVTDPALHLMPNGTQHHPGPHRHDA